VANDITSIIDGGSFRLMTSIAGKRNFAIANPDKCLCTLWSFARVDYLARIANSSNGAPLRQPE
jgi:hypothetical protein